MKVEVRDPTVLSAVKPLEMAAYLRARGWYKEADLDGKGSLWLHAVEDGEEFDVTLPMRRDLADYALRMGELLQTLAMAERRSELEVLRDVMTTTADLVRVRAASHSAENGTLPLDQAVSFVERSRDMMLSAACAALEKRAFYAKRKPQQAMDYVRQVRMGQTEQGSYVLTILSPVAPELKAAQGELLPKEPVEPYERQVTRTLVAALAALDEAARRAAMNGDMAPFTEAVGRGVSANLCDAVVGLAEVSPGGALDVEVSWSRTRPVKGKAPARVLLGSDSIPIIVEAARHFRDTAPVEDFEVEGFVTRLHRGTQATEGDVTIEGIVEGHMRRIGVRLGPNNYSDAVRAHDERLKVKCTGELVKAGQGHRLESPRHFEVFADDEAA
ncbi:MAG: hypothetical protein ACFCUO_13605 [Rhodospirillales bacterium]